MAILLILLLLVLIILECLYSEYYYYWSRLKNNPSSFVSLFRTHNLPKPYSLLSLILAPDEGRLDYMTRMLGASASSTVSLHLPLVAGGGSTVVTANPDITRHILKTRFSNYGKRPASSSPFLELFVRGMFLADGDEWHYQRHFLTPGFSKGFVRAAVEGVVDRCVSSCLLPAMASASRDAKLVDLQDILQRFSFDTTCKMSFGFDPGCLSHTPSGDEFFHAFQQAVYISSRRDMSLFPSSMSMLEKLLNIGSQRRLMGFVHTIRASALSMIHKKRQKLQLKDDDKDFLSRVLERYNDNDDSFVIDVMVNLILGGYETVSSALTWFFWLVSTNPEVEDEILREIREVESPKDMVYTHAALCESMRLYPAAAGGTKEALGDDVLPDGTSIAKGATIIYSNYSMGRSPRIWGPHWAQYDPKRWLRWEDNKWAFVPRDPYSYPVFSAGPRMCIGMDLGLLQMKTIVARTLPLFKITPCINGEPVYELELICKMKGGFPVRLEQRTA